MKSNSVNPILKPFLYHGFSLSGETDSQYYGVCPFTGKGGKFYINKENGLWDSKLAGKSGNIFTFLNEVSLQNSKDIKGSDLRRLAEDRKLPESAFLDFQIGWSGRFFTIPIRNHKGTVIDIRCYKIGERIISTAGCHSGLLGLDKLVKSPKDIPVYICEGEWDAIALNWILKIIKMKAVVVALPGASNWKDAWTQYLQDRNVICLFDNDRAGMDGELKLYKKIKNVTRSLYFVHWQEDAVEGFDTRDFICSLLKDNYSGEEIYSFLETLMINRPRLDQDSEARIKGEAETPSSEFLDPIELDEVFEIFDKWLRLENHWTIEIMLSVILSDTMDGDPLWMFVVGPPGSGKTEIIQSARYNDRVRLVSSLTPSSLASGTDLGGTDPSLIPKLNGKTMIIKDFTSILNLPSMEREQIFSVFREIFDGHYSKTFGNGITRDYKAHFSILAAVTPEIYRYTEKEVALGERFLKFHVTGNLSDLEEENIILKAISNQNYATKMKEELANATTRFISTKYDAEFPELPSRIAVKIARLSILAAWFRGTVSRNTFRPEIVESRYYRELGTRIGYQLTKFARSLAKVRSKKIVTDEEYFLCKKIVIDSVSQRNEDIVRQLYLNTSHEEDALTVLQLVKLTRYPQYTVRRLLDDLVIMEVVNKFGPANQLKYQLTKKARGFIEVSEIYTNTEELQRITHTDKIEFRNVRQSLKDKIKGSKNGKVEEKKQEPKKISPKIIKIKKRVASRV